MISGSSNSKFPKLNGKSNLNDSLSLQGKSYTSLSKKVEEVDINCKYLFYYEGLATYYGKRFHGRKTASGEKFDKFDYSAAHKKLPFGTIVRVRNTQNDKSIFVRINDRGPFSKKRIIDLSSKAAEMLEIDGVAKVEIDGFKQIRDTSNSEDENNFYGYSYINDLVYVKKRQIIIMNSTDDFGFAVGLYNELKEKKDVFLFVQSKNSNNKKVSTDQFYYIGKLKSKIGILRTYNFSKFN